MKYPPILQILVAAAIAWVLARYIPIWLIEGLIINLSGFIFLLAGAFFLFGALIHFWKQDTTIDPLNPAKAQNLVVNGLYRITRNPMYVGLAALLVAWCFYCGDLIAFVVLPLFLIAMTELQIKGEERALKAKFGKDYSNYTERVRRWL